MKTVLYLAVLVAVGFSADAAKRAVAAKGTLLCGKKPAEGVVVRLFRTPQGKKDDTNQILDERLTGQAGMFEIFGNTNGFALNETTLDPVLSFYHYCGEDKAKADKKGYRHFNYHIPSEYVNLGSKAKKVYDLGTLNIELEFPKEKHDSNFKPRP